MSNPKGAGNDPSMDDILKSIRKIISDDEARAQVGQAPPSTDGKPSPGRRDDVLLLTNPIEEPKSGASAVSAPVPPRIDPVQAAEMPQPSIEPPADGSLLGSDIAGAASSAFARLNQAMQDSVPAPTAADPGPARPSSPAARRSRIWSRKCCVRCSRTGSISTFRRSSNAMSNGRSSG